MKFYVTERLGPKRSLTPEGFLLCQDVPVARVGFQDYHESELPLEADRGVIRVQRLEDEVFKPEALASIAGKSVVITHPDDDVSPDNWRDLEVGVMLTPRRGEGSLSDRILCDFLIKDPRGIKAIVEDGMREVSLGYDAEYEMVRPGLYTQHTIIVNHGAIVPEGRCGPACSIGDHSMPTTKKPLTFKDRLLAAFKAKDEAAIEKLAGEVTEDEAIAENDLSGKSASGITINVHGQSAAPAAEKSTTDEGGEGANKDDPMKPVMDAIGALGERIAKLEGAGSSTTTDADGDDDEDEGESTNDADGDDEDDNDKGKDKTKDGKGKTRDSAGLATTFQDTIARAEILSPGIKVPTFDAKVERKKTQDALCAFRRKVLDKAFTTDEGKAAIEPLLAGRTLDTKKMTCDAASILFTAASENMKAVNRAATTGTGKIRVGDMGSTKAPTIGDMNKSFGDFWKPKV